MNEEQRKQRDARVAELAEAAADAWDPTLPARHRLVAEIGARINLALDEQAKEIAAAIKQTGEESDPLGYHGPGHFNCWDGAAEIAAGFGDDR